MTDDNTTRLDPTHLARDLTAKVGASARFAFGRSVRENTGDLYDAATLYAKHLEEWAPFTREVFANLYDPDELRPLPSEEQSSFGKAALHALEMQPSFPTLREAASAHRSIAAKSSARLSRVVGGALGLDQMDPEDVPQEDPRRAQDTIDALTEALSEAGASEQQIADAEDEAADEAHQGQAIRQAMLANLEQAMRSRQLSGAMAQIAADAQKAAERVSLLKGCGLGRGTSEDGDEGIDEELLAMLEANPTLVEALKEMGRLKEAAAAAGETVTTTGACDVVGVVPDDDPARLLPAELALLDDHDLGDHTMGRLADGETLCWELEGTEHRDRGDVIMLVDKSGSMQGHEIILARALAAAILINAQRQGRRVVLCMFGSSETIATVDGKGSGLKEAIKTLGMPASDWSTNTAGGLRAVLDRGFPELRDPDVLVITDGAFPFDEALQKEVERFPEGTRFSGLMIDGGWGEGSWPGEHDAWLDNKWGVRADKPAHEDCTVLEIFNSIGRKGGERKA